MSQRKSTALQRGRTDWIDRMAGGIGSAGRIRGAIGRGRFAFRVRGAKQERLCVVESGLRAGRESLVCHTVFVHSLTGVSYRGVDETHAAAIEEVSDSLTTDVAAAFQDFHALRLPATHAID